MRVKQEIIPVRKKAVLILDRPLSEMTMYEMLKPILYGPRDR